MDANRKICPLHRVYGALGFSAKRRHIRCALLARMEWPDAKDEREKEKAKISHMKSMRFSTAL